MDVSLFDYELPAERIAQEPAEPRDASRLLVLDRARGAREDARFSDLPRWLRAGDCLVVNESRVIPARLIGALEGDGRPAELLMLRPLDGGRWEALVRPGKRCRLGAHVLLAGGAARATVLEHRALGARAVEIEAPWPVDELMERHGLPPLPPYIERHDAPKPRTGSATRRSTRPRRARWRRPLPGCTSPRRCSSACARRVSRSIA